MAWNFFYLADLHSEPAEAMAVVTLTLLLASMGICRTYFVAMSTVQNGLKIFLFSWFALRASRGNGGSNHDSLKVEKKKLFFFTVISKFGHFWGHPNAYNTKIKLKKILAGRPYTPSKRAWKNFYLAGLHSQPANINIFLAGITRKPRKWWKKKKNFFYRYFQIWSLRRAPQCL